MISLNIFQRKPRITALCLGLGRTREDLKKQLKCLHRNIEELVSFYPDGTFTNGKPNGVLDSFKTIYCADCLAFYKTRLKPRKERRAA